MTMIPEKREHPREKPGLHLRNRHRERYDFRQLIESCPGLAAFVSRNAYQDESVDFSDPAAVRMLNRALLNHFYNITSWDIPPGYLCPPIPGRADYIHHMADLLRSNHHGKIPTGPGIRCLDIGTGTSCIYPIIGNHEYGWSFTGTDTDPVALASAKKILDGNPSLKEQVELRLQEDPRAIFRGIIREGERFDLTICNPPFHSSPEEARASAMLKLTNLKGKNVSKPILNFGGQYGELCCEGGEARFIRDMVFQSRPFATSCSWFSTLVSKQANLKGIYEALKKAGATEVKTIPMGQGNKKSRIVTWRWEEENKNDN